MLPRLTGLLLGAGASLDVGMPLVWELTNELRAWLTPSMLRKLNAGWRVQGGGHPDVVIDDLCTVLVREDMHYEAVIGYLAMQFQRPANNQFRNDYHALHSWMVEMVYHILRLRHTNNTDRIQANIHYLQGVAGMAIVNEPLWIFSLNHDVLIECVAAEYGIPLNCGFTDQRIAFPRRADDGTVIGKMEAEVLASKTLETSYMPFLQYGQKGINLFKVHGGLDIFTHNDGSELVRLLPLKSNPVGVIDTLRAAHEELFYQDEYGQTKVLNEITYADDDGELQFLRRSLLAGAFKFEERVDQVLPKPLLHHFKSNLGYVTILVSVGYSFGDIHINQVVREWLEIDSERRLRIVSPGISSIPTFLSHVAPQVVLHDCTATEFFDTEGGVPRDRAFNIETRFKAWTRKRDPETVKAGLAAFVSGRFEANLESLRGKIEALIANGGETAALTAVISAGLLERFEDQLESYMRTVEHRETSERAYYRWLSGGKGEGRALEDWLAAETWSSK